MPLDEGESLSRSVQQIKKACQDIKNAVADLGTGADSIARDKLRRIRTTVQQCRDKNKTVLESSDAALQSLKEQFHSAMSEFDRVNADSIRKERQTFRQAGAEVLAQEAGVSAGEQMQVNAQKIRPIDLTEFHTEEAIQREKLRNAKDIETDMRDLKTTYHEFNALVNQQQSGVDMMENHVAESHSLIERGHGQIQQASRHQKKFRKIGCIIGVVVALVVVVVIIIAVFASK
ncbi:syntaxin 7 [Angomonas deanei]|uniref:SNARE domain containing protein, putative n=1 Tax=Angomonas deanei TaxID=59799 RepID=S9X0S1_9TRYP|nr:syntaxin 7 [Angomonas deanei]EPY41970.1 syntaxin 7 [Angomonas deanei]EPY42499.1 syntaxin 7 [Angomonas deanei]EPY43186.1 syntaxin 7 [Angomonas deanei]CAD2217522.1 SNARE domain containing protein, putative [Angomonas deanei]|eukprot:EPY38840.1 syntaxin 7 [Angomonas deanei]